MTEVFDIPDPIDEPILVALESERTHHGNFIPVAARDHPGYGLTAASLPDVFRRKLEPFGEYVFRIGGRRLHGHRA